MARWEVRAMLVLMFTHIAAVVVASGAAAFFALMAWAGQHHS
jgi:hypothetical protein